MKNLQIDKKTTFQVRLDRGWQKILTQLRGEYGMSIKALVEQALSDTYGLDSDGKFGSLKKTVK